MSKFSILILLIILASGFIASCGEESEDSGGSTSTLTIEGSGS